MDKSFACVDVVFDCNCAKPAESEEELLIIIQEYAKNTHKLDPIPPDLYEIIKKELNSIFL